MSSNVRIVLNGRSVSVLDGVPCPTLLPRAVVATVAVLSERMGDRLTVNGEVISASQAVLLSKYMSPGGILSRPLIVGLGGTPRSGSSSECALRIALAAAGLAGATTAVVSGRDLVLPIYDPTVIERSVGTRHLVSLLAKSDGIIISSPGYHGSISGLVKNALDYAEDLRSDARTYFEGRAIGCIVCAYGWQATGTTLVALRSIVHALRGWPTPLGVTVNSAVTKFEEDGACSDAAVTKQLEILGRQVVEFALSGPALTATID